MTNTPKWEESDDPIQNHTKNLKLLEARNYSWIMILVLFGIFKACETRSSGILLIGVISQPLSKNLKKKCGNREEYQSYVANSYSSYISQTGSIPVLIPWDSPYDQLVILLDSIDMILLPGGGSHLRTKNKDQTTSYMRSIDFIIHYIIFLNRIQKKYVPLVATCLGMEQLIISFSNMKATELDSGFDDVKKYPKMTLIKREMNRSGYWKGSKGWYKQLHRLFTGRMFYFYHNDGKGFASYKKDEVLKENFRVTSLGHPKNGKVFLSTMEHYSLPFYANMFHPEKHQFERNPYYKDMVRSNELTRFIALKLIKLVSKVKEKRGEQLRTTKDLPKWILNDFSPLGRHSVNCGIKSYERIFPFPKYN